MSCLMSEWCGIAAVVEWQRAERGVVVSLDSLATSQVTVIRKQFIRIIIAIEKFNSLFSKNFFCQIYCGNTETISSSVKFFILKTFPWRCPISLLEWAGERASFQTVVSSVSDFIWLFPLVAHQSGCFPRLGCLSASPQASLAEVSEAGGRILPSVALEAEQTGL